MIRSKGKFLFLAFLFNGILANSRLDQKFNDFWQKRLRPIKGVNRILNACKIFGGPRVQSMIGLILIYQKLTSPKTDNDQSWVSQALFNMASCAIIKEISCGLLNGGRPVWQQTSLWRPFRWFKEQAERKAIPEPEKDKTNTNKHLRWKDGRAVSGHALMSSVMASVGTKALDEFAKQYPSLSLVATVTKPALVFSAIGCSLSRINDESHYLSQVIGGSALGTAVMSYG